VGCLIHSCLNCEYEWCDNIPTSFCPACDSRNIVVDFDEEPNDVSDEL